MKKPKLKMTVYCEKCGKLASVDEKHSNENWRAYDMTKTCGCGGKFVVKHEIINEEEPQEETNNSDFDDIDF